MSPADPLDRFSPAVREWFRASFDTPTRAQELGWPSIAAFPVRIASGKPKIAWLKTLKNSKRSSKFAVSVNFVRFSSAMSTFHAPGPVK